MRDAHPNMRKELSCVRGENEKDESYASRVYHQSRTQETRDAFIREILGITRIENGQEAYADEMRRFGWRG